MPSIEWWHCPWPWTPSNHFKPPLFSAFCSTIHSFMMVHLQTLDLMGERWTQSMINWTVVGHLSWYYFQALMLEHRSLSQRSSSSVYSNTAWFCHTRKLVTAGTCINSIEYHRRRLSVWGTGAKFSWTHRRRKGSVVGEGTMASAEHEPIMGVWGQKPPEAESILVIGCPTEPANLAPIIKFSK